MVGFFRQISSLVCDGVPLARIARATGTPVYVYSAELIRQRYRALDEALAAHPHALHYALKANSTLALARLLAALGSGADCNSGGEIEVALRAGFTPDRIVFTGVGKTTAHLEQAIAAGVKTINAESAGELDRIDALARARGVRARVALRVNPDIDALSHPHISTGLKANKFGISIHEATEIGRRATARPGLALVGVHVHIGSQIVTLDPIRRAACAAVGLARELRAAGVPIEHVDVGGGLGISYDGSLVPDASAYAQAVLEHVAGSGFDLIVEPGRAIVGPAGALVGEVVDVKDAPGGRRFAVLDAGMTELLRPALYGAFHRIEPLERSNEAPMLYDVVGPLCESSDVLGRERLLPPLVVGDLVAVLDAGAYGAVMASNYNRRPLPAEVLVDQGSWRVIRRRQTIDDLLALED